MARDGIAMVVQRRPSDGGSDGTAPEKRRRSPRARRDDGDGGRHGGDDDGGSGVGGGGGGWRRLLQRALRAGGVEQNGIRPIPVAERTNQRFFNMFTVWFSINSNILGVTFGMLGPAVYGLSLRDSALVIVFFGLLATAAPAALAVLGPKTGMRQMVQARYSFGCVAPRVCG